MLITKIIHWPIFLLSVGLILIAARIFSGGFGVAFWIAAAVLAVAVLINGIVAIFEDERPGGFNNPKPAEPEPKRVK